jgi:phosphatidylinositol-3-phosphatase
MRRRTITLLVAVTLTAGCSHGMDQVGSATSVAARATVESAVPTRAGPAAGARTAGARGAAVRSALRDPGPASRDNGPLPACGRDGTPPATFAHVVWIWLENRSYGTVIGGPGSLAARTAPYFNELARRCGLATNYHNISHPSQPNYFAAVAGTTGGVTTNCEPSTCSLGDIATLFTQLTSSGRQFRSYEESMPEPCTSDNSGSYVDRHNPEVYFSSDRSQCKRWDVTLGTRRSGPLATALRDDALPAFSFITPNVCSDMHSCSTQAGDEWLARWVPEITGSPGYQRGDTALFITFDEGENGHTYNCARNTTDVGCHVATIVVSPCTRRGTRSGVLFNHYSLLKTTEQLLGIKHYLGHAGDRATTSMVTAFRL